MKIFIDTASIKEIREAASLGLLDGVTTNPSLVAKEGKDFRAMLDEILAIVDGPVSAEVISTDYEGILKEGRELAAIHKNIVVKVPLIKEGLKAVRTFSDEGIKMTENINNFKASIFSKPLFKKIFEKIPGYAEKQKLEKMNILQKHKFGRFLNLL